MSLSEGLHLQQNESFVLFPLIIINHHDWMNIKTHMKMNKVNKLKSMSTEYWPIWTIISDIAYYKWKIINFGKFYLHECIMFGVWNVSFILLYFGDPVGKQHFHTPFIIFPWAIKTFVIRPITTLPVIFMMYLLSTCSSYDNSWIIDQENGRTTTINQTVWGRTLRTFNTGMHSIGISVYYLKFCFNFTSIS
jgi:hypothetical protein